MSSALKLDGVDAFSRTAAFTMLHRIRGLRALSHALPDRHQVAPDPGAVGRTRAMVEAGARSGFASQAKVASTIDSHYPIIEQFLEGLP